MEKLRIRNKYDSELRVWRAHVSEGLFVQIVERANDRNGEVLGMFIDRYQAKELSKRLKRYLKMTK